MSTTFTVLLSVTPFLVQKTMVGGEEVDLIAREKEGGLCESSVRSWKTTGGRRIGPSFVGGGGGVGSDKCSGDTGWQLTGRLDCSCRIYTDTQDLFNSVFVGYTTHIHAFQATGRFEERNPRGVP